MFKFASTLVFLACVYSQELAEWSQNQALQPGVFVESHLVLIPQILPYGYVATIPGWERSQSVNWRTGTINDPAWDPQKSAASWQWKTISHNMLVHKSQKGRKDDGYINRRGVHTRTRALCSLIFDIYTLAYNGANWFFLFWRVFILDLIIFLQYTCCNRKL